jgi:hypothetical protein
VTVVEMNRGGRPPKTGSAARPVSERPRTLASYGITKDQSSKWQELARIPDEESRGNPRGRQARQGAANDDRHHSHLESVDRQA